MKNTSAKLLLAINVIFLMISIIFLSNAYLGAVEKFDKQDNEIIQLKEKIKNETEIEKLRTFSMFSIEVQNGAFQMVDSILEFLKIFVISFCTITVLNIYFLYGNLRKNKI